MEFTVTFSLFYLFDWKLANLMLFLFLKCKCQRFCATVCARLTSVHNFSRPESINLRFFFSKNSCFIMDFSDILSKTLIIFFKLNAQFFWYLGLLWPTLQTRKICNFTDSTKFSFCHAILVPELTFFKKWHATEFWQHHLFNHFSQYYTNIMLFKE